MFITAGEKKRALQDMDLCLSRQHSLSMEWSNLFLVYERRLVHGDHRRSRRHWRLVSLAQTTSSATNSITKLRPAAIYRWLSVWLRHHGWGNLSAGHCTTWIHTITLLRHHTTSIERIERERGWIRKRDPEPKRNKNWIRPFIIICKKNIITWPF